MDHRYPADHETFIAALPALREHFESAAKTTPCHAPILNSFAHDLRLAATNLETADDAQREKIATSARFNLVSAHQGLDYYPMMEGAFERAIVILNDHKKGTAPKTGL
ncbi:MAG: hypothetical protein PW788_02280 [Micavibrio sp.]|nr:hypothetical protein [Micavibrio sp.]